MTAATIVNNNHGHAAPAPIVAAIVLQDQNPPMMITSPRTQSTMRIVPLSLSTTSRSWSDAFLYLQLLL
jgi:hypothetical protein